MDPKTSAVDPYPELISMHGSILLSSFMLLTKSARFGPKWCLSRPTILNIIFFFIVDKAILQILQMQHEVVANIGFYVQGM